MNLKTICALLKLLTRKDQKEAMVKLKEDDEFMSSLDKYIYLCDIINWKNFDYQEIQPLLLRQLHSYTSLRNASSPSTQIRTAPMKADLKRLCGIGFPPEFKQVIAELSEQGMSMNKISKHVKVNFITIRSWILKAGEYRALNNDFQGLIKDLVSEGMSPFKIASQLKSQDWNIIKCLTH